MIFSRLFVLVALCVAWLGIPASARIIDISIIHTTDIHGHIWPTTDYDGRENVGGILRLATGIEAIRRETPNTLLIDCGDTFQGSPESYLTRGRLIIDALNHLNYDAWVLGNHEFDWGVNNLRALHDMAEVPFLAANLYFNPTEANWLPGIQPYVIREIDGIKVAIIGLVTPGIPRWSRPHLLQGAMFKSSVETLQNVMPEVKAKSPDIIIVATHQGYKHRGDDFANQIQAIASTFPEIDVLLGGHSHVAIDDMRFGSVLYSQAGYHGIWLGRVDIQYDTVRGKVTSKSGRLEDMDESVPNHEGLLARWKKDLDKAEKELNRKIGETKIDLSSRPDPFGRSSVQQLISRAIKSGTDADLVLHGSLSDVTIPAGILKYRDIWKLVPYENTIGIASLTPRQIREILTENFSRMLTPHTMGPAGFTFEIQRRNRAVQISNMRDDAGVPLHPRKRYRVAINSYVLASGGERYLETRNLVELPEVRLQMLDVDTRSLVTEFIRKNSPITMSVIKPDEITETED